MKTQHELYSNIIRHLSLIIIAAFVCMASSSLLAQTDLPPLPPGASYNNNGSMTTSGGGGFQPEDSGPPGLPGGGSQGGGSGQAGCTDCSLPDYGYGFYLSIAFGSETNTVVITLHNTTNGSPYMIESATNLLGPWYTNQSLLATNVSPNTNMVAQPIEIESYEGVYFRGLQATPGQLRWAVQLTDPFTDTQDNFGGGLDAAPSLSPDGQTVYMTTPNRTISAVDALTGMIVWTDNIFTPPTNYTAQKAEFTGSAAVTSSNVYVGSCDGNLYCLNATNGFTNWVKFLGTNSAVYATPAIDTTGRILVPTDETVPASGPITGLTCLNPANGATEWFFQPQDLHDDANDPETFEGGDIESSPAVANDGTIYFLAEGWRLYSVDPTGKLNWFIPIQADGEPDSSVAIDSFGRALVGCNSEYIFCVNSDGSLEWTLPDGLPPVNDYGLMQSSPTIGLDDALYSGTGGNGGALFSLDSSGDPNWVINPAADYPTFSSPAVGESNLYFGSVSGEFFAITLSNQTVAWSYTNTAPIYSSPLICPDGSVVYGDEDGWLYCFWGSTLPAGTNAPWPTFHQNNQRTGLQRGTETRATNSGAPFLSNGTNDGAGNFTFDLLGSTNGSWTVYTSTNLSNWVVFATNVTLHAPAGNPTALATNTITDDSVLGETNRYYQLSNSNGWSRAIGFTRLMIAPGTNLLADQFCQVDDGVLKVGDAETIPSLGFTMNDLNGLFLLPAWATNTDGSAIFAWNGSGFDGDTNLAGSGLPDWIGGGNMTMTPGMSFIISNGLSVSYPIWFTGLVRNQQVFSLPPGTNYLSATAPVAGNITNITGYIPHNGDVVKLWNTSTSNFVSHPYTSGAWGTNGVPVLGIGQGFVLISTNAYVWTNNWTTMAP